MGSKYKISEKEAKKIVKKCNSIADFCRFVGWKIKGDNYKIFHKYEKEYKLDTSHFIKKCNNLIPGGNNKSKSAIEYAKGKYVKSSVLLKKMVAENFKEWKCESCGNSEWLGEKIPLELHHIDGDHFNNSFENIMLLCPNCHAKTDTYKGKKNKKEKKCCICGGNVSRWSKTNMCIKCIREEQAKAKRPSKEELKKLLEENNFVKVANMFNVSDNCIRKWCKNYGMSTHSKDYKTQN